MLFPAGERFFIRAVKRFEARIDDPKLRAEVRSFYGQEGRHGAAHERYFEELRDQGYDIDGFLAWFDEKLLQKFANTALSADMQLSITVALEHYTATLAEMALTDPIFSAIDPSMRELFYWHALIPFSQYMAWKNSGCDVPAPNPTPQCNDLFNTIK